DGGGIHGERGHGLRCDGDFTTGASSCARSHDRRDYCTVSSSFGRNSSNSSSSSSSSSNSISNGRINDSEGGKRARLGGAGGARKQQEDGQGGLRAARTEASSYRLDEATEGSSRAPHGRAGMPRASADPGIPGFARLSHSQTARECHSRATTQGVRTVGNPCCDYNEDGGHPVGGAWGEGGGCPFPNPEGDCTLLRQVDDFLLITTSKAKAEAFVRVMHDKSKTREEWGFSVHEAKSVVNFDMALEGGEQPGQPTRQVRRAEGTMFPWCGIRFDTRTCEVMANYSRYSKSSVSESLTVESRRAGACLVGKMKRFMSPKCHALMLDEGELGINSRNTVLLNVYEMLLVCAAKTAASALRLPRGPAGNASLLSNGALETTAYAYSLIQSRSNRRKGSFGTSKGVRCICKIHRFEVTWLGLHAFREVFGAFSRKDPGFTRCKLDMENAILVETIAGSGGGADKEDNKTGRGGARQEAEGSGGRGAGGTAAAAAAARRNPRRGGAYNRLRHVMRSPDALSLLHTLTT
ncbi:unnamed protein product, partial [Pylaiella littoralis]